MTEGPWTLRRMLQWMTDDFERLLLSSPRLDAELLLAEALSCQRVQLYLDLDRPLDADELSSIRALVKRRRAHEPVAYILGRREFYGRSFEVDSNVLVPRPDTETLVDQALERIPEDGDGMRALDLCTGSGCIAITLAAERGALEVVGTDLSSGALAVANTNAQSHGVLGRVQFSEGDLWAGVPEGACFDVITSNPPYIAAAEWDRLSPEVTGFEPRMALLAPDDGLAFYRQLASRAEGFLKGGGSLLLEVGHTQAQAVSDICRSAGLSEVQVFKDLGAVPRVVVAKRHD